MLRRHRRSAFIGLLLLTCTACQIGEAAFSGDLGGQTFDPNGTVFSYVDEFDATLSSEPRPEVVVAMTWLIFDPHGDLSGRDGAELERMRHELGLRDAMSLVFPDQAELLGGARYISVREAGVETGTDGLRAVVHLAPERLDAFSTYANFTSFGSRRTVTVDIDEADFNLNGAAAVSGEVSVQVERDDMDPADARIGTLQGTFFAPLVEERAAEHNLGLLTSTDVLGVPERLTIGAGAGADDNNDSSDDDAEDDE